MPNLNIPISEELLRDINLTAMREGKRQKDWVIEELTRATAETTIERAWRNAPKAPMKGTV
jgi:hypothetical protein